MEKFLFPRKQQKGVFCVGWKSCLKRKEKPQKLFGKKLLISEKWINECLGLATITTNKVATPPPSAPVVAVATTRTTTEIEKKEN